MEKIYFNGVKNILKTERKELKLIGYDGEISNNQVLELIKSGVVNTFRIYEGATIDREIADKIDTMPNVQYPVGNYNDMEIDINYNYIYFRPVYNWEKSVENQAIGKIISNIYKILPKDKDAALNIKIRDNKIIGIDYATHFIIRNEPITLQYKDVKETIESLIDLCSKGYGIYLVRENRILYYNI